MNVLPAEEQKVLLQHGLDVPGAESLADGAAMFMVHHAGGLVEHLPAALPGEESEVGIFEVERSEKRIEAAELEEFPAIECARSATAIEAGEQAVGTLIGTLIELGIFAMAYSQPAILPPAMGQAGFFAALRTLPEEDLAGYRKNLIIGESGEKRRGDAGFDAHVVVQEYDDIVLRSSHARVRTAAEAKVFGKREQVHFRMVLPKPGRAAVGRSVIDDDDFAAGMPGDRVEPGRQKPLEQVFAIPVRDDERSGARFGLGVGGLAAAAGRYCGNDEPDQVGGGEREGADREKQRREEKQRQCPEETQERRFH